MSKAPKSRKTLTRNRKSSGLSEIARLAEVSPSVVTSRKAHGKLIYDSAGKLDLKASAAAIKRERDARNKQITRPPHRLRKQNSAEPFVFSQARKEAALADLRELEYREKRGTLIDVNEAAKAWASVAQIVRENVMGIPDRIAQELAALTDAKQVRERLLAELRLVLTNLPAQLHDTPKPTAA